MEVYYEFLVENIDDFCNVLDPETKEGIDFSDYIILNKKYRMVSWARSEFSPYYHRHIPFYASCPVLEVEGGKLIMLYYYIYDQLPITNFVYDEIDGICEIEEIGATDDYFNEWESQWLKRHYINYH